MGLLTRQTYVDRHTGQGASVRSVDRVAVDAGADLVGEGDVALGGERGGAGDVGPAGGAVGDVLQTAR